MNNLNEETVLDSVKKTRILYGVQGTGNGHISRARSMALEFKKAGIEVQFLFSGRPKNQYFDMEVFGDYWCKEGLTFVSESGRINHVKTVMNSHLIRLIKDIRGLDLLQFDLVLSDFEPITAWAAKLKNVPSIAMGHQNAFDHDIPKMGNSFISRNIMKYFAPAPTRIGLHWHHFSQTLLPPIIHQEAFETHDQTDGETDEKQVLVYLPFENNERVLAHLRYIKGYQFQLFSKDLRAGEFGAVTVHPLSSHGFKRQLDRCQSVLCNAGFELVSEALNKGRRIMVKPTYGQMEQMSNAKTMQILDLAWVMDEVDRHRIEDWLENAPVRQVFYPDTAAAIVNWIKTEERPPLKQMAEKLWLNVRCNTRQTNFEF